MGRELPPDEVLAADQRIRSWAEELKKAGLEGGMDELRARAYLDLLLGKDSRPRARPRTYGRDDARRGPPGTSPAGGAAGGFAGRVTLTVPLGTAAGLADRPGELAGHGPVDPWLARDLVTAAAREPEDDVVRDRDRRARARRRARLRPARTHESPETRRTRPAAGRGRVLLHPGQPGRPARRTRHLAAAHPGTAGRTWIVVIDTLDTRDCQHRYESRGHDPGVRLRHLSQIRHATCTSPVCRRPAAQCDFEHNTPYEAGGRTCLCNGGPKCRHDHRLKQQPGWTVDQLPDGTFQWTTPAGRTYTTEPTRYPV